MEGKPLNELEENFRPNQINQKKYFSIETLIYQLILNRQKNT